VTDLHKVARELRDAETTGRSIQIGDQTVRICEVFTTEFTQAVLYTLRSGQSIPRHRHTGIDDVFLGVVGQGRIRTWGADGGAAELVLQPGCIEAVTPGTVHEVVSDSDDFAYLLLQAPKEDYDLIPVDPSSA
jgi:quercetin dioxygenase-like cupin family protein